MSELINKIDDRAAIRRKLLAGTSALAFAAYIVPAAHADDIAQPQVWIELGGQLSRLEDGQEQFSPQFPNTIPRPSIFAPSQPFERPPSHSLDELGSLSFQPKETGWTFSATVRYGRSDSHRHVTQQTNPKSAYVTKYGVPSQHGVPLSGFAPVPPIAERFADTEAQNSERHLVLDFQAGKDVGLGIFGGKGSSVFSLGVRFAQFQSKSNITIKSDPDWHFHHKYYAGVNFPNPAYHSNFANFSADRSFHGVGPSLSWSASSPFIGDVRDGELSVDWRVNAAVLFGRQRARTHHQTTGRYHGAKYATGYRPITFQHPATPDHMRSHNVTVPNVGGTVGITWRLEDFKASFGYRADFFFGAMDGGIDAHKSETVGFYGPFASVSIGLGN